MNISLETATKIYDNTKNIIISSFNINNPVLKNYCIFLWKLRKEVSSHLDDTWNPVLRSLTYYRYNMLRFPLAFNHKIIYPQKAIEILEKNLVCFPENKENIINILDSVKVLVETERKQLCQIFNKIQNDASDFIYFVIHDPSYIKYVEKFLQEINLSRICVVNVRELLENRCYNNLLFMGPLNWYPDYVIKSPRSSNILVIKHNWLKQSIDNESILIHSILGERNIKHIDIYNKTENEDNDLIQTKNADEIVFTPEEIVPVIDWEVIHKEISQTTEHAEDILVIAKIFLVIDEMVIYEKVDSTVLVIELNNEPEVKRKNVEEIEPGDFILVRSERGGKYLSTIANKILGENEEKIHTMRNKWKRKLRAKIEERGISQVVKALKYYGSNTANEANVRNWASQQTIKTRNYNDFVAIMKFISLEDKIEQYWIAMEMLEKSRRKAGFHIRGKLLEYIKEEANLNDLKKYGHKVFDLPNKEAGSISALQVIEIMQGVVEVSSSKLSNPYPINKL